VHFTFKLPSQCLMHVKAMGFVGGGGSGKVVPGSLNNLLPGDQHASDKPHLASAKYAVACQPQGHPEGPYFSTNESVGSYQNFSGSAHMLSKLVRGTSGAAHMVDWQLNLRGGMHRKPDAKWRRYFSRPQKSFDAIKENCGRDNETYQTSQVTPRDNRPDRRAGCITIEHIRDDPLATKRWAGCEGTQVGQWQHLIEDRKHGMKNRSQLAHETTIREVPGDDSGRRIDDNRTDACLVEMLGKKKWYDSRSCNPLAAHPQEGGDVRLHHLSTIRPEAEGDEENRRVRTSRHPRLHVAETSMIRK